MTRILKATLGATLLLTLSLAQCPLAAAQLAAPETHAGQVIHPDRSVTFNFIDPGATKVALVLENTKDPLPMAKNAAGTWTVTTPPLAPELYGYSFVADGQSRVDPWNPAVLGNLYFPVSSEILIPGATPQPWEATDIPHGELHRHQYTTHIARNIPGNQSEYIVYTPPGYDPTARKTYPVLYLLHGWSDYANGWSQQGKANLILDSLIAEGKAKPMIVVMPFGYGDLNFVHDYRNWDNDALIEGNLGLYTQVLLTEILPLVESEYRASKDRRDRAIAGLSMGGLEALSIGLNHTPLFAYVAGFSAAVHRPAFIQGLPVMTAKSADLKLLWISCGTGDGLLAPNQKLAAFLKDEGLPVTEVETPGLHVWPVWRDNLVHIAPLLFQSQK